MSDVILEMYRVTKNYRDTIGGDYFQVLNGIDLQVKEGAYIAIHGPSGAGKTTLMNIIGGNIMPSTGKVFVRGLPLHLMKERELELYRRNYCGFLWQDSQDNLIHQLTVRENLEQAMNVSGYPTHKRKDRIKELLTAFDIWNRREHRVTHISGGEALRASLSVAMVNEPELLLCDEPTGELDSITSKLIIDYLDQINKELGQTIIVVTHDRTFDIVTDVSYDLTNGNLTQLRYGLKSDPHKIIATLNSRGQIHIPEGWVDKFDLGKTVEIIDDPETGELIIRRRDVENNEI
jgi:putative ABC transport system ATP-binding protein